MRTRTYQVLSTALAAVTGVAVVFGATELARHAPPAAPPVAGSAPATPPHANLVPVVVRPSPQPPAPAGGPSSPAVQQQPVLAVTLQPPARTAVSTPSLSSSQPREPRPPAPSAAPSREPPAPGPRPTGTATTPAPPPSPAPTQTCAVGVSVLGIGACVSADLPRIP